MNIKRLLLIAIISLIPLYWWWSQKEAPDSIIETMYVRDILSHIEPEEMNPRTLVMFDIDNTIIAPKTDLGSDQWFYAMVAHGLKRGLTEQQAVDEILPVYAQIINQTPFYPVEPDTTSVIKELQDKGVSVIALTARSLDLAHRTVEHLHDAEIHFTKTDPHECPIQYGSGKPALYIEGIIFSGNYPKGEVLLGWLNQIHYKPKKIIFIDDKLKNVKSVESAVHKRNIPFVGLRYGYLDERVKKFDWDKTQKELDAFIKKHSETRPILAN